MVLVMPKACVSEATLIARITARLLWSGERLNRARPGSRLHSAFGRYYVKNAVDDVVTRKHVNLESLGRELGVLGTNEEVQVSD